MHGVRGLGNYQYLWQLRQSQRATGNANSSTLQSATQGQLQGAQSTTEESLPAFLVSLLRNTGGTASTSPSTATNSASQQGAAEEAMSESGEDGEGSMSQAGVQGALSGRHHRQHGGAGTTARAGSPVSTESLFDNDNSDGDGTTTQSGTAASQGCSTTSQPSVSTGVSALLQQAINKYTQLSPASEGVAGLGSVLATA